MKLLQKLFGSSKKGLSDDAQHYSIDDHPGSMVASSMNPSTTTQVNYASTATVEMVDGNVVSAEKSESIEVWGD